MTATEIIRAKTPEDAVNDMCSYLEDMVVNRPLSKQERRAIRIKMNYWQQIARYQFLDDMQSSYRPKL